MLRIQIKRFGLLSYQNQGEVYRYYGNMDNSREINGMFSRAGLLSIKISSLFTKMVSI